jgi:hypothetical protein
VLFKNADRSFDSLVPKYATLPCESQIDVGDRGSKYRECGNEKELLRALNPPINSGENSERIAALDTIATDHNESPMECVGYTIPAKVVEP